VDYATESDQPLFRALMTPAASSRRRPKASSTLANGNLEANPTAGFRHCLWKRKYLVELQRGLIVIPREDKARLIREPCWLINGTRIMSEANCLIRWSEATEEALVVTRIKIFRGQRLCLYYGRDYDYLP
jgi:hypothetical protein